MYVEKLSDRIRLVSVTRVWGGVCFNCICVILCNVPMMIHLPA